MYFLALMGINRIAWDTKLLLMAVLAHPVDCISSCHILNAQHSVCCFSPNGCFNLLSVPHPLTPPIDSIHGIAGTEKNYLKKPAASK